MSRITDDTIEIELNGAKYRARLDILAIAELQFYLKTRGYPMTVPQIFEAIQNNDWFVISNLLVFTIKSCAPAMKMYDIFENMKFNEKEKIISELIRIINKSMPEEDSDKKKVEETNHQVED